MVLWVPPVGPLESQVSNRGVRVGPGWASVVRWVPPVGPPVGQVSNRGGPFRHQAINDMHSQLFLHVVL